MRKNYLWMAVIASMLSFTACNDDASSIVNGENPDEVVMDDGTTFELAISNTGIGTRAARPLGSSAAANTVNKVQLKFYMWDDINKWVAAPDTFKIVQLDGATYDATTKQNIIDFTEKAQSEGVPGTTDRIEEKHTIKMKGMAPKTKYRIVAYGYNGEIFPYAGTAGITEDETEKGLFTTATDHKLSGYQLEEVFAGYRDVTTASVYDKKLKVYKFTGAPEIEITRQVAGILAYFKIPTTIESQVVKTVKVIANAKSDGFKFPNTLVTDNAFNGVTTTENEDVLMEFDMSTAASNWNNGNPEGDYYKTGGNETTN